MRRICRKRGRSAYLKNRSIFLSNKERLEVIDLFELSPISVTDISGYYGICRRTVYRIMHKYEKERMLNGNN